MRWSCAFRSLRKCIAGKTGRKQNKKYIAVTGGIGSGKTTVLNAAKEQGYPCFSADAIARGIYDDPSVLGAVRGAFPLCVKGDRVDRAALAAEVFSDGLDFRMY